MEGTANKNRTPSRCREWERNRRNKFNDALSRLGELVKEINRSNDSCKDADNIQYPKIEIIEKAIICLTNCSHEKTQLKSEILSLQVKIDTVEQQKPNKKDVSTQVFIGLNKKRKDGKYVKVLMLQKPKRNALKEKSILTTNVTVESKAKSGKKAINDSSKNLPVHKLPTIFPRSNLNNKKGPENTIVVLPATPYLFPQRPLLFPTVPPAFVIVDQNVQTLNKSYPLVNRNNGDITKTTMVNILPISAYSRPLSATKARKNNLKSRQDVIKRPTKKVKQAIKVAKASILNDVPKRSTGSVVQKDSTAKQVNSDDEQKELPTHKTDDNKDKSSKESKSTISINNIVTTNVVTLEDNNSKPKEVDTNVNTKHPACNEVVVTTSSLSVALSTALKVVDVEIANVNHKTSKLPPVKESLDKDKENKLPNILDTALSENAVDTGNARLELAEEFLAASPTAAFLMSFPLVSGNRADSPAEDPQNTIQINSKDNNQRRSEITTPSIPYFEKPTENKTKTASKHHTSSNNINKQSDQQKFFDNNDVSKQDVGVKNPNTTVSSNENPFLNLPMPSLIPTSCTLSDQTFGMDFDCNINKSIQNQSTSYASNSNLFYKSDPFSTVKSTIYSTSSISSGHEFNSFGLYPCAMEKYSSKNKSDYSNVEENLMKIGSSRLTYDIDLGWSHKSFDFVNCTTTPNTFNKDNILTTGAVPYSSSYNPFNPEFHVPLPPNTNKKENGTSKPSSTFAETITSFYSQPTNLWSEEVPFYANNNVPKALNSKPQNYLPLDHVQTNIKPIVTKQYDTKLIPDTSVENVMKSSNISVGQQIQEKYTKKSPNKMHINWMTSEIRPMQNNCNPLNPIQSHVELKEIPKLSYGQQSHPVPKKHEHNEGNYFPISMHNFSSQPSQEEIQVWPSTRPAGTTEISIEPPPINLPTLVGDLALGPHDKKKNMDIANRAMPQTDIQNCSNFFSVTQLMNRSSDNNMSSRFQGANIETPKSIPVKSNLPHSSSDANRKSMTRIDSHLPQAYNNVFNDSKSINCYEVMNQFSHSKSKTIKSDKSNKVQKNSYSAESLIRGGTCTQKPQDSGSNKFMVPTQKYNDFTTPQNSSVAQVSHFPPILDYSDNSYTGQQFSGTANTFYSNFMPGSSNLMSANYTSTSGPFSSDFIDYNQSAECNYTNHKYDDLKMRNNSMIYQQDKVPSNYKSSRRDTVTKHKLECSKKESSKKYQSKRTKVNSEIEEWSDTSHLLWQNKTPTKRHSNLMSDELPFPNYVGNQMPSQYQPDFFNSHLMSSNMQSVGPNVDRTLNSFPVTSRANFNLSTLFPEITMKVQ